MSATVAVLGVRHHGPGSARSVRDALAELDPDIVLIEGPADADPLVELAADPELVPPVALLGYAAEDAHTAAFWPFAAFSPEWQALQWAAAAGVPARFCDLPAAAVLARRGEPESEGEQPDEAAARRQEIRFDPLATLANAAGHDDPERWWEDLVESRMDTSPFDAITDAMREMRNALPVEDDSEREHENRREAHMRQVLRTALKDGHTRVAVICGAWHAPALTAPLPPATADAATLRGLPKRKAVLTWVPWTHGRLTQASGYGAGVASPGWYAHLFTAPDRPVARWFTAVAAELRGEDLPVSSAHIIEAVRLSDTLAALRGRPLAGLAEVTEATRAVLCEGDDVMVNLVTRRLVVGEALGHVPERAPSVPLDADIRAHAKRLRLKLDPAERALDLDLRKETDRDRSRLLHRLTVLGIGWGVPARGATRNLGTFRETWALRWRPEIALDIVDASTWGTTVAAAAAAKLASAAESASLAEVTAAVERCLLADLSAALPMLLAAVDARAAQDLDVVHLMSAVGPLARAVRYGDVRDTGTTALAGVADTLLIRINAGLPAAVTGLDADAAGVLREGIEEVQVAVALLDDAAARQRWTASLTALADRDDVHPVLTGRIVRLLLDTSAYDADATALRLSRALSRGMEASAKAAWVEGFLAGGGMVLVHDAPLLALIDAWVSGLDAQGFVDVLPLLRRTFGGFASAERRAIGAAVLQAALPGGTSPVAADLDPDGAAAAVATVALLLGVST